MSETYADIKAARVAANKLWPAELSLDFMGRDWSLLDGPFSFEMRSDTVTASDAYPGPVALTFTETLSLELPDAWALDATYDDMDVAVRVQFVGWVDIVGASFNVGIADSTDTYIGSTTNVVSATPTETPVDSTLIYPLAGLPSGRIDINVRATPTSDEATILTVRKVFGAPDCQVYVRLTP